MLLSRLNKLIKVKLWKLQGVFFLQLECVLKVWVFSKMHQHHRRSRKVARCHHLGKEVFPMATGGEGVREFRLTFGGR